MRMIFFLFINVFLISLIIYVINNYILYMKPYEKENNQNFMY